MKKKLKSLLAFLMCVMLLVSCVVASTVTVSAASYPSLFLDVSLWGVDAELYAGDMIDLKFNYYRAYNNERVHVYILDEYGDQLGYVYHQFGSAYGSMVDYTVNWDTSEYDPGVYTILVVTEFYSFYSWHESPTNSTWSVTLLDPAQRGINGWYSEGGKWVYYERGNKVVNSWRQDSKGWCYLGADGAMMTNVWVKDSKGWCYVGSNGYCVTNTWKKDSKGWCYLDSNGRMKVSSWVKDSNGWCYVGADGYMVYNAWVKDSIGWCHVGANGYMEYNKWVKDSTGWCYVGSTGYMVTNAWVSSGGKWYYMNQSGYMVTGRQYIDGKYYTFDSNGVWVP